MNESGNHKRRVRYKGTYPKKFEEKYKEHRPEEYTETIEKIIQKGSTPVGMHLPICVNEIMDFLQVKPGQIGLDATLGYGGHGKEILTLLNGKGHLYALDVDPIESLKTKERLQSMGYGPEILTIKNINFSNIDSLTPETGLFDFVLADLGVSSMQLDTPDRGFSYKTDGPLDLRLNPNEGITAAKRLENMTQEELEGMLIENADEPYAKGIAKAIISRNHRGTPIETTSDLRGVIEKALSFLPEKEQKDMIKKSCQRTFQALRIDINHEFEALHDLLEKLPYILKPEGRVAILTFHSGEDRLVKKSFKQFKKEGLYKEIATDVIRPSAKECVQNGRAKSAKLRWAIHF